MESAPEEKLEIQEEERGSDRGCSIHSPALHARGFQQVVHHARPGGSDCHADPGCVALCYGVTLTSMAVVLAAAVAVWDCYGSELDGNCPHLDLFPVDMASAG